MESFDHYILPLLMQEKIRNQAEHAFKTIGVAFIKARLSLQQRLKCSLTVLASFAIKVKRIQPMRCNSAYRDLRG